MIRTRMNRFLIALGAPGVLALAVFTSAGSAEAGLTSPFFRVKLRLNKEKYDPGDVPTLDFESNGSARIAGFIDDTKEAQILISPDTNAVNSSPFPPIIIGEIEGLGTITVELPMVTCASDECTFIQGKELDAATGQLESISNEVKLVVVKDSCDPTVPGQGGGGQGCFSFVWSEDENLEKWPFTVQPDTLFGDVFNDAFPGMTMFEVLTQFGNFPTRFLGRQAVAALLNAESPLVDADLDATQVIGLFNGAFPGNLFKQFIVGVILLLHNAQDCPLSTAVVGPLEIPSPPQGPQPILKKRKR